MCVSLSESTPYTAAVVLLLTREHSTAAGGGLLLEIAGRAVDSRPLRTHDHPGHCCNTADTVRDNTLTPRAHHASTGMCGGTSANEPSGQPNHFTVPAL